MNGKRDGELLAGVDPTRPIDLILINSPLKNYDFSPRYNDFTLPVLGLGYIATYAHQAGFNVAVLDAEALGLGISRIVALINAHAPRWVGLNLLAPTYRCSLEILQGLDPDICIMLGGHQAKAMPQRILHDPTLPRIDALILGEGEYRAVALLQDLLIRKYLPHVWWRDEAGTHEGKKRGNDGTPWLAPNISTLPFVDRAYFAQDPFLNENGLIEANMVGSRGCPYDCSFCGAALSANPDISIRTRDPQNIIDEMEAVAQQYSATAFRFVDDLFLASPPFMKKCLKLFTEQGIGSKYVWDATGRINILNRAPESLLDLLQEAGCREVALGIESGSDRMLRYIDKRITPNMVRTAFRRLTSRGIHVKGYFILGFPTETQEDVDATEHIIQDLWEIAEHQPGSFRCSVFEFRPYPGTPEWYRLMQTGKYTEQQLLQYEAVDLTGNGTMRAMLDRDEFNFSVNLQFGEVPIDKVRETLTRITLAQKHRM
jgi:radical SAM superfamily enzyme YgiQ (UPF0313 family)